MGEYLHTTQSKRVKYCCLLSLPYSPRDVMTRIAVSDIILELIEHHSDLA